MFRMTLACGGIPKVLRWPNQVNSCLESMIMKQHSWKGTGKFIYQGIFQHNMLEYQRITSPRNMRNHGLVSDHSGSLMIYSSWGPLLGVFRLFHIAGPRTPETCVSVFLFMDLGRGMKRILIKALDVRRGFVRHTFFMYPCIG